MRHTESVVCPNPTCAWRAEVSIEVDADIVAPWRSGVLHDALLARRVSHVASVHVVVTLVAQ